MQTLLHIGWLPLSTFEEVKSEDSGIEESNTLTEIHPSINFYPLLPFRVIGAPIYQSLCKAQDTPWITSPSQGHLSHFSLNKTLLHSVWVCSFLLNCVCISMSPSLCGCDFRQTVRKGLSCCGENSL